MKSILIFILSASLPGFAATQSECLGGSFAACRDLFNEYGSRTNREGAVDLFEKACSAQTLMVTCQIVSVPKGQAVKKMMDMHARGSGGFSIDGERMHKLYQISETK